jgi:hypothetical protein
MMYDYVRSGVHFATNDKARIYYWTYCGCNLWNEQVTGADTTSTALPEREIPSAEISALFLRQL